MKRVHWGRVWSYVGIAVGAVASVAGNVAHAYVAPEHAPKDWHPEVGLVIAAGFAPVGLLIAVEVLTRIVWPKGPAWLLARFGGVGTVAAVVAVVSYQHLSSLLRHYNETNTAVAIYPLAVDGLMIVCSAALIALHVTATSAPGAYQSPATDLYDLLGYSGLKNVTARAPLAAVTDAGSGSSPAPDPADSPGRFLAGWTADREPIGSAMTPTDRAGPPLELDSVPAGKPAGSTPTRSDRPANGADPIGSGGTKPTRSEPRSTPARSTRSIPDDWTRIGGSEGARLEALRLAVRKGWITRPLSEADVTAVVQAGGPKAREWRDQINDEDEPAMDGDEESEVIRDAAH